MVTPAGVTSTRRAMSRPAIGWSYSGVLNLSSNPWRSFSGHAQASNVPVSVPIKALRRPVTLV